MVLAVLIYWEIGVFKFYSDIRIVIGDDIRHWHKELLEFEEELSVWYPLGDDTEFRLSHGINYSEFYRALWNRETPGNYVVYVIFYPWDSIRKQRRIRGTCAMTFDETYQAWYIGDLKIHPDYRGYGLPKKMLTKAYWVSSEIRSKGSKYYAVTMQPTALGGIIEREDINCGGTLYFYLWRYHSDIPEEVLKEYPYLYSNAYKKDLLLRTFDLNDLTTHSTDAVPINLWHFSREAPLADQCVRPNVPHYYILCCKEPKYGPTNMTALVIGNLPKETLNSMDICSASV